MSFQDGAAYSLSWVASYRGNLFCTYALDNSTLSKIGLVKNRYIFTINTKKMDLITFYNYL